MPSWGYGIIVILIICVLLSGFFSGSEIVYAKVNSLRLEKASKKGDKKAVLAYTLKKDYPTLINTILVGNNLVNIGASSAATLLATAIWKENGALIATTSMTIIILIFGEILPKTLLSKYSYNMSLKCAKPLKICEKIFKPVVYVVNRIVVGVSKIWTPKEQTPIATDEELITMVDEIQEKGYIDENTGELVRSAIDFVDVMAYEIMQPRVDIISFDIDDDIHEFMKQDNFFVYSRILVYEDTIDNVLGIVSTNKLLKLAIDNKEINVRKLLTQPIFVHKTKTISSILTEFREKHVHFAVVIDEFGGVLGIVTLEDILEELVGDIWDETDEVEEEFTEKVPGVYTVDGDMNIYDMFDLVEKDDSNFESEYSTVGGWCTEQLEKFPEVNDTFEYENLNVTILKVDGVRVEKAKIVVLPQEQE